MSNYSIVRLSDGETIPLATHNDLIAIALLSQRECASLSRSKMERPNMFAKSDHHTFWCKPSIPVYRANAYRRHSRGIAA
jgi:hypothetical protein